MMNTLNQPSLALINALAALRLQAKASQVAMR